MIYFIIFIITFLCPSVSAILTDNDYSQEAFSGYFDVLINFMVPFIIFIIVDYDYDDEGSKKVAQLVRTLIYFVIIGVQQELAFKLSATKVSSFIEILQHTEISLLIIGIIGEISLSLINNEEKDLPSLGSRIRILKQTLEENFKIEIESRIKTLVEDINKQIITHLSKNFNTLQKKMESLKGTFLSKSECERKVKIFEERIENLEEKLRLLSQETKEITNPYIFFEMERGVRLLFNSMYCIQ
ncbi:hypothetical protein RclHR1_07250003 [Rhizophagus clarus]|uniref:Uncharacterized protein n=1 Tax=Rhizophagus clarus TaxID=94130 RepID=A0A2Z6RXX2_9GLOM|nr:hypothetical protein RclHR1_07250003 [Rhizophagus clarus]